MPNEESKWSVIKKVRSANGDKTTEEPSIGPMVLFRQMCAEYQGKGSDATICLEKRPKHQWAVKVFFPSDKKAGIEYAFSRKAKRI